MGRDKVDGFTMDLIVAFCFPFPVAGSERTTDTVYTDLAQTTETGDDGTLKLLLLWQVRYNIPCDANVRPLVYVVTVDHTLHPPNQFVPIAENDEYNVTIAKCEREDAENTTEVNVALSLLLNDNVLKHVPYIQCSISTAGYGEITSKVHLPLHTVQCKTTSDQEISHETTGGIRTEPDLNKLTDDCHSLPCSASLRHSQVLQLCIILLLITTMLCEVL